MKPFNLEEAKAGKPIVNVMGVPIRFIAHVPEAKEGMRVVCVSDGGNVYCYPEATKQLFMAQVKRGGWVNIYKGNGKYNTGNVFDTEEEAKKGIICSTYLVATTRIEWEE